jgi:hypothetical protein
MSHFERITEIWDIEPVATGSISQISDFSRLLEQYRNSNDKSTEGELSDEPAGTKTGRALE